MLRKWNKFTLSPTPLICEKDISMEWVRGWGDNVLLVVIMIAVVNDIHFCRLKKSANFLQMSL